MTQLSRFNPDYEPPREGQWTEFNMSGVSLRATIIDGHPWFIAKDAADALGYGNSRDAVSTHVSAGHRRSSLVATPGMVSSQRMTIIDEAGLYRLIMRSTLSGAIEFQDWVTDTVLPTIRRTGGYNGGIIPGSYAEALEAAARHERELTRVRPRAELMQMFSDKRDGLSIGDIGVMVGYRPHQFHEIMRSWGATHRDDNGQINASDTWVLKQWAVQRKTGSPAITYEGLEEIERRLGRKVVGE